MIERKLDKRLIWIDRYTFRIFYYDELIIQVEYDGIVRKEIGEEWSPYLMVGKFEELKLN